MYTDYILYGVSIVLAVLTLVSFLLILKSNKVKKMYKRIKEEETMVFDAYTSTVATSVNIDTTQLLDNETVIMTEEEIGKLSMQDDYSEVTKNYDLEEEILGGGMSRIFKATNRKLGNQWIVKYIPNKYASLANEENILKKLNHINLPQIIDIYHGNDGVFLVERFIEGITLDKVLETGRKIPEVQVLDWAEQLSQVLGYLHTLEVPIYHCDLKPSNIMVTYDNKLVLIDFGISLQSGQEEKMIGATYKYAAPEQLKKSINSSQTTLINERFGKLPPEVANWKMDGRTDIYSLGVILYEMICGTIPTVRNKRMLETKISREFAELIYQMIETNPDDRIKDTSEILNIIKGLKQSKSTLEKRVVARRFTSFVCSFSAIASISTFGVGSYITNIENLSIVNIEPQTIQMSIQQGSEIFIQKTKPNGEVEYIEPKNINWTSKGDDIAKIDGNYLYGINVGNTKLEGRYRDKIVKMSVEVVEKTEDLASIALRYKDTNKVNIYAGNGERDSLDGELKNSSFISPESMVKIDNGDIYVSDSGFLRCISNGQVTTVQITPSYISPKKLLSVGNQLYAVTDMWQDAEDDKEYFGIVKIDGENADILLKMEAAITEVIDAKLVNDNDLYFLRTNPIIGSNELMYYDINNNNLYVALIVPDTAISFDIDSDSDIIYMGHNTGVIKSYIIEKLSQMDSFFAGNSETGNKNGVLGVIEESFFAGIEDEKHFIDGDAPRFYSPQNIKLVNGDLFVLDFNVLRKITIENNKVAGVETVCGCISTEKNPKAMEAPANEFVIGGNKQIDFIVDGETIYISSPKQSVIFVK